MKRIQFNLPMLTGVFISTFAAASHASELQPERDEHGLALSSHTALAVENPSDQMVYAHASHLISTRSSGFFQTMQDGMLQILQPVFDKLQQVSAAKEDALTALHRLATAYQEGEQQTLTAVETAKKAASQFAQMLNSLSPQERDGFKSWQSQLAAASRGQIANLAKLCKIHTHLDTNYQIATLCRYSMDTIVEFAQTCAPENAVDIKDFMDSELERASAFLTSPNAQHELMVGSLLGAMAQVGQTE